MVVANDVVFFHLFSTSSFSLETILITPTKITKETPIVNKHPKHTHTAEKKREKRWRRWKKYRFVLPLLLFSWFFFVFISIFSLFFFVIIQFGWMRVMCAFFLRFQDFFRFAACYLRFCCWCWVGFQYFLLLFPSFCLMFIVFLHLSIHWMLPSNRTPTSSIQMAI